MGALLLALVAAMTPFVAEPNIAYAQALADADLTTLTVTGAPGIDVNANLSPSTVAEATDRMFTARIPFITTGVNVTATTSDSGATIKINGQDATSETPLTVPGLTAGRVNNVNVVVTAAAGNKLTYTVKVYRERQDLSDNANLSSLSISPGSLTPGFRGSETSYNTRVKAAKVTVSYRLSDTAGGASAAIVDPDTGVEGMDVELAAAANEDVADGGTTTITVMVTPESVPPASDNECDTQGIKCYTIEIYRIRNNESINANLITGNTGLTLRTVADSPAEVDLTPGYVPGTTSYKARVVNSVSQVTVGATKADAGARYDIMPRDADGNTDGHQVSLAAGAEKTITVKVTAEDSSSTKPYEVKVYRDRSTLSQEARLSRLSLSGGALDPSFNRATLEYDVRLGPDVGEVTVSYATVDTAGAAVVAVTALTVGTDGVDASPITLMPAKPNEIPLEDAGDATRIKVTVTPEAGATDADGVNIEKEYVITIYRTRIAPSADASLATLEVSGVTPAINFDASDTIARMLNATASNAITSVAVTAEPTAADNGATVDIDPASPVALTAGAKTLITITVTAEDGTTTSEYMVYVYRLREEPSDDATLSALSVSGGDLSPAFMSDRLEYNARVGSDVDKVTVSYTPTDNAGGVSAAVTATDSGDTPTACGEGTTTCAVSEMEVTLEGAGSKTIISVAVSPESGDADDKTYMITVYRERPNLETDSTLSAFSVMDDNPVTVETAQTWQLLNDPDQDVGYRVRSVVVMVMPTDSAGGAVATITAPPDKDPNTALHEIDLTAGAETMIMVAVQAEDPAAPAQTYTANVYRQNLVRSDDATLSSLMLSGVTLMYKDDNDMDMTGFMSDVMAYTGNAASEMITVTATANHLGAKNGITVYDGTTEATMADGGGYEITLGAEDTDTTVTVQVKPESVDVGAETDELTATNTNGCIALAADRLEGIGCYTVTVTRTATAADPLLAEYDVDNSGNIEIEEVVQAVQDYAAGEISIEDVVHLVQLYASG